MARPASRHPTELELEILKVLWREGPLPVRKVRDALAAFRDLAYTTVITVMNIMVDKKYLTRKKRGPVFVYRPRVTRKATTGRMLRDMVERVFNGSAAAVMLRLLESSRLDEAEIRKVHDILDHQAEGRKE